MLMNFPILPRSWNRTTPSIRANSESSRPNPTLSPGLKRVPRCRTRMEPPVTNWPPNRLTPNRWELLSRPLRELPPAFLWAIASPRAPLTRPLARVNLFDDDRRERLPVAAGAPVLFAALLLENENFLGLVLGHDPSDDPGTLQDGPADLEPA